MRQLNVGHYLFLGDATGYFPQSAEVCETLAALPLTLIAGNHEGMLMGALSMADTMRAIIQPPDAGSPAIRQWVQRCARTGPICEVEIEGRHLRLVHGSPDSPWQGRVESLTTAIMRDCDVLLSGHTHRPCINKLSTGQLHVNPGSCGYPRDNGAWLSVAILDTSDLSACIFRLPNRLDTVTLQWIHPEVRQTLQRNSPITGTIVEMA